MSNWIRVASLSELPADKGKEVVAENRVVALFRVDEDVYAIDGICLHAGGPLADGKLSGTVVTCPWHGWQYDVTSGEHCLNKNLCAVSFAVDVRGDDVYVRID
ncbi:MAG: Rieske 2Fe-2S domain-containing protein [Planctomycetota bacterium]|nr:Rieske 2Fe-2S domain-containing protein [Planctomycetota bacterium]MDA1215069.1 Rieske 2Fe-2S domain-containing protein [Planctomycetota bacterium]